MATEAGTAPPFLTVAGAAVVVVGLRLAVVVVVIVLWTFSCVRERLIVGAAAPLVAPTPVLLTAAVGRCTVVVVLARFIVEEAGFKLSRETALRRGAGGLLCVCRRSTTLLLRLKCALLARVDVDSKEGDAALFTGRPFTSISGFEFVVCIEFVLFPGSIARDAPRF